MIHERGELSPLPQAFSGLGPPVVTGQRASSRALAGAECRSGAPCGGETPQRIVAGVTTSTPAQPAQRVRLGALRAALLAELEPEITRALQVAVLLAAGHRCAAICKQLGCTSTEFTRARLRLRRAAKHLEAGDARGPRSG